MTKILIVDDDKTICLVLEKVITDLGYDAIISCNGKQAWDKLSKNDDIKLIITDIVMPEINGKELINMVRDEKKFSMIPIVIMSSVVAVSEVADLLAMGSNAFLNKPLRVDEVKKIVLRYLEMGQG